MHKMTGDITEMAAQVPALFEALSGMPMSDLLSKVRKIGDKAPKPGRRSQELGAGAGPRGRWELDMDAASSGAPVASREKRVERVRVGPHAP